MIITRISPYTGKTNTMDLDVTEAQMAEFNSGPRNRLLIQQIVPDLSATEREFIKTGYTQSDWDAMFPTEEE